MLKEEVPVELPIAAHARDGDDNATPTLAVAADGSVALDGTPIPSDALGTRLREVYETRADKAVMLAAARTLAYERVVEVMDACREAGIERIAIVTAPPPPPSDPTP